MSKINKKIVLSILVIGMILASVGVAGMIKHNTPEGPNNPTTVTDNDKDTTGDKDVDNTPSDVDDNSGTSDDADNTPSTPAITPATGDGTATGTDAGAGTGTGTGTGDGGGVAPLDFLNIALSPAGNMTATPSSPTFIMTFDRGLTDNWVANKDCFKIYKDGSATNVLDSSAVTMIDKNNIQLSPTGLIAGASYNIVVSSALQANNGNTLGTAVTKSFTVAAGIAAPNYVSSAVTTNGDVNITFNKNMESTLDLSGKNTQFIVTLNNSAVNTTAIERTTDTAKIKLTLQTKAKVGDVLTIQYTKDATGAVKAEDGGVLENFGPSSVTNTLSAAAPLVSSAITGRNNDRVTISFNKAMADPSGQQSAFKVTVIVGGSPVSVVVTSAALNVDPTKIDLILSTPITTSDTVTVAYTKGSVTSSDGGILKTFAAQSVTNQYGSAPNFVSSEVTTNGDVSITFDKDIESTLTGKDALFTVTVNGSPATVIGIQRTTGTTKIKLLLQDQAVAGNVITVKYTKDITDTIKAVKAEDGGVLENFGPSSVTNTLLPAAPTFVSSAVTNNGDVSITFDKKMESTLAGKDTQFTVMVNGAPATITGIIRTTDTTKIKLTLQTPAAKGNVITVQYTKDTTDTTKAVKAEDGGMLDNFGPVSVTNAL